MTDEHAYCRHADLDTPGLICGYPLPCPDHTAVIDLPQNTTFAPNAPSGRVIGQIIDIADVFKRDGGARRVRAWRDELDRLRETLPPDGLRELQKALGETDDGD